MKRFIYYYYFLIFIYLFGCAGSQLRLAGSLVAARLLLSCGTQAPQLWHVNSQLWHACGIQFPDQGLNLGSLHWECGVLTTAPPGKSLKRFIIRNLLMPLWRLTSSKNCSQQAGDLREILDSQCCSSRPNICRLETQEKPMPQLKAVKQEEIPSQLKEYQPLVLFMPSTDRIGGQYVLLILLIQMLISYKKHSHRQIRNNV